MADDKTYLFTNVETNETGPSSRDFTGKGIAKYMNEDTYEGEYTEGVTTSMSFLLQKVRNGKGKYGYTAKGFTYEGGWSNNKKTGIGKMDFGTKGKYFGTTSTPHFPSHSLFSQCCSNNQ